jgi:hypothetical protein
MLARAAARQAHDADAESTAERALGLAARELNDLPMATRHLRRAVAVADGGALPVTAARARMSLALIRALQGATAEAFALCNAAAEVLGGLDAARLRAQLSLIVQRLGRFADAAAGYREALAVFRREGDRFWEAKLLNNRGVMEAYRGRPQAAEADLARSEHLYMQLGQELAAIDVRWNRGFAAGRTGAIADALEHFAVAGRYYREHGVPRAALLPDHCEVLLAAGLYEEAKDLAAEAVAELGRRRMAADLAEARLMLAQAALAAGDHATAAAAARRAGTAFDRQGRPGWAAVARYVGLRVTWSAGRHDARILRSAVSVADELAAGGWAAPALDARLIAARVALRLGRVEAAAGQLQRAGRPRRHDPLALRVGAWYATALLRLAGADERGAQAALRAGLRAVDQYRLTLGATELRVHVAQHGADLASTGLGLAVRSGRPMSVLAWAERWRARSLLQRPVTPPADTGLSADLAELRTLAADREQAVAAGRDATRLSRRMSALERAIRDRVRRVSADGSAPVAGPALARIADAVGDRALIDLTEVDGRYVAVVVTSLGATLHILAPVTAVAPEISALRFGVRRLVTRSDEAARDRARRSVGHSAATIDALVLQPLRRVVAERALVVVPSRSLHDVPWSFLPTCAGRPVTLAPSAALALRADEAAPTEGGVVFIAGPGLPGAEVEVATLAAGYHRAECVVGARATTAAVLAALDGAGCAHVAAHGRFRADNPQFSTLTLADGPLTVYDLETLRSTPRLVLLSACDSGVSAVSSGDELMGFAAALFALGTRTVIASVVPVPDGPTVPVMVDLHDRLRRGESPAEALAGTRVGAGDRDVAAAFVCLGSG